LLIIPHEFKVAPIIVALLIRRRLPDTKRVKSVQNFVHLNFSLSLLLALIVFVVGIETATGSVVRFH
jgi:hypothetical protein